MKLRDYINEAIATKISGIPSEVFEVVWRDALVSAVASAQAVDAQLAAVETSPPPTTIRLQPATAVFFITLSQRLGISVNASLTLALDGMVRRAFEEASNGPSASP